MGIYVDPNSENYSSFYGSADYAGVQGGYGYDSYNSYPGMYGVQPQTGSPYLNAVKPGFMQSAWGLLSPFSHTPLHQTPGEENAPYYSAVGTKPVDAAATIAQRVVIPGLAVGVAQKLLGANTGSFWKDLSAPFRGEGMAAAFGKGLGSSAASRMMSGLGFSSTGYISRGVTGAAGMAGGVLAGFGLPLLAAEGVARAANYTVFDPYVSTRRAASDLKQNFFGTSLSGVEGDYTRGGRGLGASEAISMAQGITRAGIKDYNFDLDQYTGIANMLGKSGALDSASARNIVERVKSSAEQIKLIVQISKDPNIQKAVEELSKLQLAGASLDGGRFGQAGRTYAQLGMYASSAGVSVQKLMSGVGAQGQSAYSSMGMTPYLGQLAAGNIYSGFAAAYRSGLISEGMMARMGGIDNATRTAMAGGLTAARSPMMQVFMYNTAAGKGGKAGFGGSQDPIAALSVYGQDVARDPLSVLGMQMLYGPQMAERFMENQSRNIEESTVNIMRQYGIQPSGKNGKYTIEQMAPFMQSMWGMTPEQIQNFAATRMAETDPATVAQKNKGLKTQGYENTLQYLDSQGLTNTPWARAGHAIKGAAKAVRQATNAYISEPLSSAAGYVQEAITRGWHEFQYGDTVHDKKNAFDERGPRGTVVASLDSSKNLTEKGWVSRPLPIGVGIDKDSTELTAPYKGFDFDVYSKDVVGGYRMLSAKQSAAASPNTSNDEVQSTLSTIQEIARTSGHPAQDLADRFMKETDDSKRGAILSDLIKNFPSLFKDGAYDRLFGQSSDYKILLSYARASQIADVKVRNEPTLEKLDREADIGLTMGNTADTAYTGLRNMGKVMKLGALVASKEVTEATIDRYVQSDSDLEKLVGDRKGKKALDFLLSKYNNIRGSGFATQASLIESAGDLSKLDPASISDPTVREKFVSASSLKQKQDIYQKHIGSIAGPGLKINPGMSMGWQENAESLAPSMMAGKKMAKNNEDVAANLADYSSYRDISKAFERPVDKFNEGVKEFVDAVRELKAERSKPQSSTSSSPAPSSKLKPFDAYLKKLLIG
jgi:hypothetical protein